MSVKVNLRTKIIIDGKEYSSPDELPPELRRAYDQALAERGSASRMQVTNSSKITFNGQTYTSLDEMPEQARQLYDRAMEAVVGGRDGIPDAIQGVENSTLPEADNALPMNALPVQPSPISQDRPGQARMLVVVLAVLVVLLAAALLYFGFIR